MPGHALPPYHRIINFGSILDLLSEYPIKHVSEEPIEVTDKSIEQAKYDAELERANNLLEVTEILYEMLDVGFCPTAKCLKALVTKLFKFQQYGYVILLYDMIRCSGVNDIELINTVLRSCKEQGAYAEAYSLFNQARLHRMTDSKTYCIMLNILAIDRSLKGKSVQRLLNDAQDYQLDNASVYAAALYAFQYKTREITIALSIYNVALVKMKVNASVVNRILKVLSRSNKNCLQQANEIYAAACLEGNINHDTAGIYQGIAERYATINTDQAVECNNGSDDKINEESAERASSEIVAPPVAVITQAQHKNRICSFGMFTKVAKAVSVTAVIAAAGWAITNSGI
jgi:predicted metal-binding protein